jgi:hypothetical protein
VSLGARRALSLECKVLSGTYTTLKSKDRYPISQRVPRHCLAQASVHKRPLIWNFGNICQRNFAYNQQGDITGVEEGTTQDKT